MVSLFYESHFLYYLSYKSMNRMNLIGLLLFLSLAMQLISGILSSYYYSNNYTLCFNSVVHMLIDISYGYLIRLLHVVGSSCYMFYLIIHYIRGWYRIHSINNGYSSNSWIIGVIIMLLSLIIGYIGYTLNWGQMSFWGVTVIVSIIIVLPLIGYYLATVILPSFCIGINRLFSFHYLVGFIINYSLLLHILDYVLFFI